MLKLCQDRATTTHFVVAMENNKSVVLCVPQIMSETKSFSLNQNLTCANYGIYAATCVICHEQYVGQTIRKFLTRWSSHRSN